MRMHVLILAALIALPPGCSGGDDKAKPKADLEVVLFAYNASVSTVTYTINVTNVGKKTSPSFQVDLFYDQAMAPLPGTPGDDARVVGSLPKDGGQALTFVRSGVPAGTYLSWVQLDTLGGVKESDKDDNILGPLTVQVGPVAGTDLTITNFTVSVAGTDVSYSADVVNVGSDPAGPFSVDLYHDLPVGPVPQVGGNDSQAFPSLAGGTGQTVNFSWIGAPPGSYRSWMQVDTFEAVAENDENNNIVGPRSFSVGAAQAELVITDFSSSVMGGTVNYSVTVQNVGSTGSGPFSVDLYYDSASAPPGGLPGDDASAISNLAGGGSIPISFVRASTPTGIYDSWAQVDTYDTVAEANEANNVAGPEVVDVQPTPQPDLVITSFNHTVNGANVTYTVNIQNQGTASAGTFSVDLYYDSPSLPPGGIVGDDAMPVSGLAAGGGTSVVFTRPDTIAGTYTSWARIDTFDTIMESDEGNNAAGPRVVSLGIGGPPDLVITSFLASVAGSTVTYSVTVTNRWGSDVNTAFEVHIWYDKAKPPTAATGNDSQVIPSLALGQSQILQFTRSNTNSGTYDSWAKVDVTKSVAESDEGNNTEGPLRVTVP